MLSFFDPTWEVHSLGAVNVVIAMISLHWLDEHLARSFLLNPSFGMCCIGGKISLPPIHQPPPELLDLLTTQEDNSFCKHIHNYNNALAMTSVG
jgi:hypothetical protein